MKTINIWGPYETNYGKYLSIPKASPDNTLNTFRIRRVAWVNIRGREQFIGAPTQGLLCNPFFGFLTGFLGQDDNILPKQGATQEALGIYTSQATMLL